MKSLRHPVSLAITPAEMAILQKLNDLGIKNVQVFRRGLEDLAHDNNIVLDT